MARVKKPVEVDPNKLKRERAGRYVTPDGRFAAEGPGANGWYIVDGERENELGLPLMAGPFATLDDARAQVANLRTGEPAKPTPLHVVPASDVEEPALNPKPKARARRSASARIHRPSEYTAGTHPNDDAATDPGEAADAPPWLLRLPADLQTDARRLLALLDKVGLADPSLVRRELEANLPEVARVLLVTDVRNRALDIWRDPDGLASEVASVEASAQRHLRGALKPALEGAERHIRSAASTQDLAAFAGLVALRTVVAVFESLDREGREGRATGEPGWRLVELDGRREPTKRAIVVELSHLLETPED